MKIFISIASYQDPFLIKTIKSAYENAANKDSLIFGICDQSKKELELDTLPFASQIKYEHVDTIFSRGPCWARQRIQELFSDEDYYFQIDSHTIFDQSWDSVLIENLEKIKEIGQENEYFLKPFITGYPRAFDINDDSTLVKKSEDKNVMPIAFRKDSLFIKDRFSRQIGLRTNKNDISHGFLLAAGCFFSESDLIKEVPYDYRYYFYGEEISLMLRLFTRGYSAFHIPDLPVYHLYNNDGVKNNRLLHWDPKEDENRAIKWRELESNGIKRLSDLINGDINGKFGLGNIRTLDDFERLSGMDIINKAILNEERAVTKNFFEELDWRENPLSN